MALFNKKVPVLILAFLIPAIIVPVTIVIKGIPGMHPVSVDVPPDWKSEKIEKTNGVIYSFKKADSRIEVRSFTLPNINMEYIINAKAARIFADYAYVSLLLEKTREIGETLEKTLFWKMVYQSRPYFEKTVIQKYKDSILILSCRAPADDYPAYRVVFENAALSLFLNTEEQTPARKEEKLDTEEIIKSLTDERNEKSDKSDKLVGPPENE